MQRREGDPRTIPSTVPEHTTRKQRSTYQVLSIVFFVLFFSMGHRMQQQESSGASEKLEALREEMRKHDLDAYILFRRDPHMNEYLHPRYEQVEYVTGFTGSNGVLFLTQNEAWLYTDSRYFLQAQQELPPGIKLSRMGEDPKITERIESLQTGKRVGVDPEYIEAREKKQYENKVPGIQIVLQDSTRVLESLWPNRPVISPAELSVMPGQDSTEKKMRQVRGKLREKKGEELEVLVITDMDEIAWMLNLRGADIPMSRLFYAYAILTPNELVLYTDARVPEFAVSPSETPDLLPSLLNTTQNTTPSTTPSATPSASEPSSSEERTDEGLHFRQQPYKAFHTDLQKIRGKRVGVSPRANLRVSLELEKSNEVKVVSPIEELKSVKTQKEVAGFELANLKDALALCRLFGEIEERLQKTLEVGEEEAASILLDIKKSDPSFIVPSFETISAFGPNGAIIHYAPKNNDTKIAGNNLYLIDSGSQYAHGTTDITRTVSFGNPTPSQMKDYTAVIRGHIALETGRFPIKHGLGPLDGIVRQHIWNLGYDYGHSTGHGVGYGLNVHEGPHQISSRSHAPVKIGMVVTNEPGIYREGEYGIRHENLMVVEKDADNEHFFRLRSLTPVPLHLDLIRVPDLTSQELAYINRESERIRTLLTDALKDHKSALKWLKHNTRKLNNQ